MEESVPEMMPLGLVYTCTSILVRMLSQLFTVCDSHQVRVSSINVAGMGDTGLPTPPNGAMYHNKFWPLAFNGGAASPVQRMTGVMTAGGGGLGATLKFTWVRSLS